MRAGRSILAESCVALRMRRTLATLRHIALLATGVGFAMGAALQMLLEPLDAAMFGAMFVLMMWGAFLAALATWRLL